MVPEIDSETRIQKQEAHLGGNPREHLKKVWKRDSEEEEENKEYIFNSFLLWAMKSSPTGNSRRQCEICLRILPEGQVS